MKKISLILLGFLLIQNLYAEDKLDILDKQSKEFFKAITGLEKNYLEEQIENIKTNAQKKAVSNSPVITPSPVEFQNIPQENNISQEQYEKTVFEHENEMARLTTDFTKTKKLKDIKIKSMYTFNDKAYVVLKLDEDDDEGGSSDETSNELSLNIEGRYKRGDYILTHRIVNINTRTKTVELYKKLDDEYGYSIYLSNYGISVSDLKKKEKIEKKEVKKEKKQIFVAPTKQDAKEAFEKVRNKPIKKAKNMENVGECLYTVNIENLNVRNSADLEAIILRVLKIEDQFTIKQKNDQWVQLDTIYKKKSGDVMVVEDKNNWLQIIDNNVTTEDENCL